MTYLITFPCYGSHMHGDHNGSVDRNHNRYGAPFAPSNPRLLAAELRLMDQPPYELDEPRRQAVLDGTIDRCIRQEWHLLAAHVRTNHVHVVVQAEDKPEFVMTQLKSAASRRLNDLGFDDRTRKRWARHGSTRRLFNDESVQQAIRYVIDGQGEPMSTFLADRSRRSRF
jgi:REP element-mobilizing transposase RayT